MEVYTEERVKPNNLYSENQRFHTKEEQMEELNVNLEQAANYLIELFYMTGRKYSCTRTKIGKILSIVAFDYAMDNKRIFKETIYKYDDCGTAIREIMDSFDRDIYPQCLDYDKQQYITDELDNTLLESEYNNFCEIDISVRNRIENAFRFFGAYSPSQLGNCINFVVSQDGITTINGEINILKLCELTKENLNLCNCNDTTLIKYLFDR